jgi:hypothetical protein
VQTWIYLCICSIAQMSVFHSNFFGAGVGCRAGIGSKLLSLHWVLSTY